MDARYYAKDIQKIGLMIQNNALVESKAGPSKTEMSEYFADCLRPAVVATQQFNCTPRFDKKRI